MCEYLRFHFSIKSESAASSPRLKNWPHSIRECDEWDASQDSDALISTDVKPGAISPNNVRHCPNRA